MPLTNLAKAELEQLHRESAAFYATHGRDLRAAPADEVEKQRKREMTIVNSDPETLDLTCTAMKNFHSPEDDRKLRGAALSCKPNIAA